MFVIHMEFGTLNKLMSTLRLLKTPLPMYIQTHPFSPQAPPSPKHDLDSSTWNTSPNFHLATAYFSSKFWQLSSFMRSLFLNPILLCTPAYAFSLGFLLVSGYQSTYNTKSSWGLFTYLTPHYTAKLFKADTIFHHSMG